MASYVEAALVANEKIVHFGRVSLWSVWHLILFGVLLTPLFGLGLILLASAFIQFKTTELAITKRRIIVKHGFIRRRTIEMNLNKVESIQVDQGVWGRMLDFGTLAISGGGLPQATVDGISEPMKFRKAFIEAQEFASNAA